MSTWYVEPEIAMFYTSSGLGVKTLLERSFFLIRVKKLLEYYVKTYLHSSVCKITYASSQRASSIIHALEPIFTVLSFTWHRISLLSQLHEISCKITRFS